MKDDLVSCFNLAVSLRMGNGHELGLTAEGAQILCDLAGIKQTHVVKDHCAGDAKVSVNVFPYELSHLNSGGGGNDLCFYPLSEIVHLDKKVLVLACDFGEGPKYLHAPCTSSVFGRPGWLLSPK